MAVMVWSVGEMVCMWESDGEGCEWEGNVMVCVGG